MDSIAPSFISKVAAMATKIEPESEQATANEAQGGGYSILSRILWQLLFGLIYYFMIVHRYPKLDNKEPNDKVRDFTAMNEVTATCHTSMANCLLSFCCTGPRAAHTFAKTEVLDYWISVVLMSVFPCCTLFVVNSCTELNTKLGGKPRECCMSAICAFCCTCCVVAQDAGALDMIMETSTGDMFCSQSV